MHLTMSFDGNKDHVCLHKIMNSNWSSCTIY